MLRSHETDGPTILLVDDDPDVLEFCACCLRNAGFPVEVACNGQEAEAFFRENPASIRLLISDVEMPFVSGVELADFAAASGSGCRVLLISGKLEPPEAAEKGWEFLAKPFLPSLFIDRVQRILSRGTQRLRALVAEDDAQMRRRICELLNDECDVVAALEGGQSVIEKSEELRPDVLVLDLSMPDVSGLAVMRALRSSHSQIPVVFVTQHTESAYVDAAFASGASGYVTKARIFTELHEALHAVHAGGTYLSADLRPA